MKEWMIDSILLTILVLAIGGMIYFMVMDILGMMVITIGMVSIGFYALESLLAMIDSTKEKEA